jgi:chromosome segregation ATPase
MFSRGNIERDQQQNKDRIDELEEKLKNLYLENQQIKKELRRLTNKSNINTTSIRERLTNIENEITTDINNQQVPIQATVVPPVATSVSPRHSFASNDRVRIKNPKKKQENTGTVTGHTAKGFVKILLDNNKGTVRRIPRNLTIIQERR